MLALDYVINHSLHEIMRIRVLAEPQSGLPQVKSWFNVEQENTVASLKTSLCASISALREARVQAIELVLLLDDFELLDNAAVNILRDGDLVWYVEQHPNLSFCHLSTWSKLASSHAPYETEGGSSGRFTEEETPTVTRCQRHCARSRLYAWP